VRVTLRCLGKYCRMRQLVFSPVSARGCRARARRRVREVPGLCWWLAISPPCSQVSVRRQATGIVVRTAVSALVTASAPCRSGSAMREVTTAPLDQGDERQPSSRPHDEIPFPVAVPASGLDHLGAFVESVAPAGGSGLVAAQDAGSTCAAAGRSGVCG
jgi:hypothetical protein